MSKELSYFGKLNAFINIVVTCILCTSMKLSDNKKLFIGVIIFIVFLILMHGNEIGQFNNTDKADAILCPILYIVCLILLHIFFGKIPKDYSLKDKILARIIIMIFAVLPMFVLSGLGKWVDYYTTNKQWRTEKVTVINKSTFPGSRGTSSYQYTFKTMDSTIRLSSTLNLSLETIIYLKMCKTNLGMIIADRYYP